MNLLIHTGGVFQTNGYILANDDGTCIVVDAPAEIADFWLKNLLRPPIYCSPTNTSITSRMPRN